MMVCDKILLVCNVLMINAGLFTVCGVNVQSQWMEPIPYPINEIKRDEPIKWPHPITEPSYNSIEPEETKTSEFSFNSFIELLNSPFPEAKPNSGFIPVPQRRTLDPCRCCSSTQFLHCCNLCLASNQKNHQQRPSMGDRLFQNGHIAKNRDPDRRKRVMCNCCRKSGRPQCCAACRN